MLRLHGVVKAHTPSPDGETRGGLELDRSTQTSSLASQPRSKGRNRLSLILNDRQKTLNLALPAPTPVKEFRVSGTPAERIRPRQISIRVHPC